MKPLAIGGWLRLHPSPLPWGQGGKVESSCPLIMSWSFWWPISTLKLYRSPQPPVISLARKRHPTHWACVRVCCVLSIVQRLCNPMHSSPLGSPVHGTSQARILEWIAISGTGYCDLLQGIFPTQGLNPCLLCLLHWQADSLSLVLPGKPPTHRADSKSFVCRESGTKTVLFLITGTQNFLSYFLQLPMNLVTSKQKDKLKKNLFITWDLQ